MDAAEAAGEWWDFARGMQVKTPGGLAVSWAEYLARYPAGRVDEQTHVAPWVFPAFAQQLLGFEVGATLAPEVSGAEGRPDFTPADAVTHPFVFETKGTADGVSLLGHEVQVLRYLRVGGRRIRRVVLTNMRGLRVLELDGEGILTEALSVDLSRLAAMSRGGAQTDVHAERLAHVLRRFRRQQLTRMQKVERVRSAPPWNPALESTSPEWVLKRLDAVVEALRSDVAQQVGAGALLDTTMLPEDDRPLIERELREMEKRLGAPDKAVRVRTLQNYLDARTGTAAAALRQFIAHTAFYTATRLLLVRAWEDSGLLTPVSLYNGGFDRLMSAMDSVGDIVTHAYGKAKERYPDLFQRHNAYAWHRPGEDDYVDAVYELANTYLGDLTDDVLGAVYQQELANIDRKQLGQYYTPRDIIRLIWDLIGPEKLADAAALDERPLQILDIAVGSGGFLVHGVGRLRAHHEAKRAAGAVVPSTKDWLKSVTAGAVGCEVQQFSAYLAEVNLVLQLSQLLKADPSLRLPPLRVHCVDTLVVHNPAQDRLPSNGVGMTAPADSGGVGGSAAAGRLASLERLRDPQTSGEWFDVAVGNPPYVGHASIADTLRELHAEHPYWLEFAALRQDYLYNFLILGVSKLRNGGRFGFITTEYWLKANGAAPLRRYLADHCRIDRLVLFRAMTLFPDAPGQHNLIVVGERITDPGDRKKSPRATVRPRVTRYTGRSRPDNRAATLEAIRRGRKTVAIAAQVVTFDSLRSPNVLSAESWAEVVMTAEQLARRERVQATLTKAAMVMAEGVLAPPQAYRVGPHARWLTSGVVAELAWSGKTGIFVLPHGEMVDLRDSFGGFTPAEIEHVRPVMNTTDVYPYAVVLPPSPPHMLWLPKSHAANAQGAFPADMPAVESHLQRFKPLLDRTVASYNESRPWWSVHRPRVEVTDGGTEINGWADLGVMTRWGDNKLLCGLAPGKALPLSGLHAFTGEGATNAAYLVGLINSTPIQELAEALAPGSISQDAIVELGLPQLELMVASQIAAATRKIADCVHELVTVVGVRWSRIPESLHRDVALSEPDDTAWMPTIPPAGWGTISSVGWVNVATAGAHGPVMSSEITDDIFGRRVVVNFRYGHIALEPETNPHADMAGLLQRMVVALGPTALSNDVLNVRVPISSDELVAAWDADRDGLDRALTAYWQLRAEVDDLVLRGLNSTP